ncbi:hypothetical protein A3709_20445 [Halioglobus sp. HI00S01]|uniref:hypothetical protein n=1 Tax=Halioglobus sp. HI00S01 TaxID=1822214 RepID=UPI0007C30E84|nr:hypothetical protein [Halioglobus sp. HI00S01]KZX57983.1 hypothetical protein A3709_20445 [Halioglobus sp. HI00S01]
MQTNIYQFPVRNPALLEAAQARGAEERTLDELEANRLKTDALRQVLSAAGSITIEDQLAQPAYDSFGVGSARRETRCNESLLLRDASENLYIFVVGARSIQFKLTTGLCYTARYDFNFSESLKTSMIDTLSQEIDGNTVAAIHRTTLLQRLKSPFK